MHPWGHTAGWSPAPSSEGHRGFMPLPPQCFGFPWIVTPIGPPVALPARESPFTYSRPMQDGRFTPHADPVMPAPPGMLNPFIAAGATPVPFDLRKDPGKANRTEFERHHRYSLFSQPAREVRLICKEFPWPIEIRDKWVVCGTVWEMIWHELQVYITESEWAMASENDRRRVDRAVRFREAETGNRDLRPRRIDWLGDKTIFAGLEKDDVYAKKVALPGNVDTIDTWIIHLDRR